MNHIIASTGSGCLLYQWPTKIDRPPDVTSYRAFAPQATPQCARTPRAGPVRWMAPDSAFSHNRGHTSTKIACLFGPIARRWRNDRGKGILSAFTLPSSCITGKRATLHRPDGRICKAGPSGFRARGAAEGSGRSTSQLPQSVTSMPATFHFVQVPQEAQAGAAATGSSLPG